MPNPSTSKIAAGLAKRGNGKPTISIASLKGAPRSLSDLNLLADSANSNAKALREQVDGLASHLDAYATRLAAEYAEHPGLEKSQRARMVRDSVKQERKRMLAIGAEARAQLFSEVQSISQRVAAIRGLWEDPIAIMKSSTWSSDRAATLRQALSSAGPVEIEAALQRSVIESDRDLASAAIQIWESWPKAAKDSVRISKREVAEALVSNEWNRARRSILLTEIANGEAAMEIARAEGRDVPSQTKIQQGLRRKKFAALNAQIESANSEGEAA